MLAELWNDLRYRLRALTRGADLDREMEDEIEAHLEREAEALERQGLPAAEARRQARLAFGGLEGVKERSRDQRGTRRLEDYLRMPATRGGASGGRRRCRSRSSRSSR